jgi:hypothetical protein
MSNKTRATAIDPPVMPIMGSMPTNNMLTLIQDLVSEFGGNADAVTMEDLQESLRKFITPMPEADQAAKDLGVEL